MLKQMLRVAQASTFHMHMCPTQKCSAIFEHLDKGDWEAQRDSVCKHCCHGRRFKSRRGPAEPSRRCALQQEWVAAVRLCVQTDVLCLIGMSSTLPVASDTVAPEGCSVWNFGVGEALQFLLSKPVLRKHILAKEHRTMDDPGTFWGSQQLKQLNEACGGVFTDESRHAVLLSLGGDGVDIVNWGKRTCTLIGLKLEDLPAEWVQKGEAVAPLFVVEGPNEPLNLKPLSNLVVDFFTKHAPSSDGLSAPRPCPCSIPWLA